MAYQRQGTQRRIAALGTSIVLSPTWQYSHSKDSKKAKQARIGSVESDAEESVLFETLYRVCVHFRGVER
jgi:hypothetical protein